MAQHGQCPSCGATYPVVQRDICGGCGGDTRPVRGEIRIIDGNRCRFIERELEHVNAVFKAWNVYGERIKQGLGVHHAKRDPRMANAYVCYISTDAATKQDRQVRLAFTYIHSSPARIMCGSITVWEADQ